MSIPTTEIQSAIQAHLREGRLPCLDAFAIAQERGIAPAALASLAEEIDVRIGWCQLGLFAGAKKQEKGPVGDPKQVPIELRQRIEAALEEGRLPCARAWGIAKRLQLERIAVGRAADALGIRISRCQLNCFA